MQLQEVRVFTAGPKQDETTEKTALFLGENGVTGLELLPDNRVKVSGTKKSYFHFPTNVAWVVPLSATSLSESSKETSAPPPTLPQSLTKKAGKK